MADDSRLRTARSAASDHYADTAQRHHSGSGGDPLAELARLIGHDNLFEKMRRDAARAGHSEPAPAAASDPQDYRADENPVGVPPAAELRGALDPEDDA